MTSGPATPAGAALGLDELNAEQVAERLRLIPHPEGGYYRETYRCPLQVETSVGSRALSTVIYYLLTSQAPSHFHRLRSDELWLYQAGAAAQLALLGEALTLQVLALDSPQLLVPGGTWVGARILPEGQTDWGEGRAPERRWTPDRRLSPDARWTLVSCVVTPGFHFDDFELGQRAELERRYPQARRVIHSLTAP